MFYRWSWHIVCSPLGREKNNKSRAFCLFFSKREENIPVHIPSRKAISINFIFISRDGNPQSWKHTNNPLYREKLFPSLPLGCHWKSINIFPFTHTKAISIDRLCTTWKKWGHDFTLRQRNAILAEKFCPIEYKEREKTTTERKFFYLPSKCLIVLVWLANNRKYSSSLSISSFICFMWSDGIIPALPLPDSLEPNESVSQSPPSVSLQLSWRYWFEPVLRDKFNFGAKFV